MPKSGCVIGIYGTANIEVFHRSINGAVRYCEEVGEFNMLDLRVTQIPDRIQAMPPPWRGKVDGVIVAFGLKPGSKVKDSADWCMSGGVPVVSVAADWFDPRIPVVHVDRPSLAELAAEHLFECECQSYAFFGYANSTGSKARSEAFGKALTQRGKNLTIVETERIYFGYYEDMNSLEQEAKLAECLAALPLPIGIWALNDNYARAVCLVCERLKLKVPEQVKVLGVDDIAIARMYHPTITSIRTPGEEIGYQAMSELHKLIDGKRGVRETVSVKVTELHVRESTYLYNTNPGNLGSVLEYIERHACSGVTLEQVVSLAGGSQRRLSDRFREHVGHSISEEIQRVRLERAKKLLSQSQLSISRIASMVGYAETAAFSKFFRKCTRISPREFRENEKTF